MEETIGYEALYSSDEWESMDLVPDEDLEVLFAEATPHGDTVEATHSCTIYDPPGEQAGNENRFEVECDRCGTVGSADTETEAKAIARLHEAFVATLVDKYDIERGLQEPPAQHVATITGDGDAFEIVCPQCGEVGTADDRESADLVKRFHDAAFELAGRAAAS